jgi:hypothetical protein
MNALIFEELSARTLYIRIRKVNTANSYYKSSKEELIYLNDKKITSL